MGAGLLAEAGAWAFVMRGQNLWTTLVPVLAVMGIVAVAVRTPAWSPDIDPWVSAAIGLASGVVLYLATRAAVLVLSRWPTFRRHAVELYARRGGLSLGAALGLSLGVSALGEELFWRGLFQAELGSALDGRTAAAVLTWAALVLANLPSANLAVVAGAMVGGALWAGLAWWSGGVLASLACHLVWTGAMIAFPAVEEEDVARDRSGGRNP